MTTTSDAPTRAGEEAAVLSVLDASYQAWADNDADAMVQYYTDDATIVLAVPAVYSNGKETIRAGMAGGFSGPLKGTRPLDVPENVRLLGDDTAIVVSVGGILQSGETELPDDRKRRSTWVLSKHTGTWLIAAYHNSPLS
jgi:uncharacterized protein (TIGR02246 family)